MEDLRATLAAHPPSVFDKWRSVEPRGAAERQRTPSAVPFDPAQQPTRQTGG
jgi:hypothetical protein